MNNFQWFLIIAALSVLPEIPAAANSQKPQTTVPFDTTAVFQIDSSAVVTAHIRTSGIGGDPIKGLDIDMNTLATFPKLLGTADPLKFVQSLPGVTTNSDWESGLHVQGCEASQSVTKLCDVPVYGQGRILGLFSVFNPGHFGDMKFSTTSGSRRIGGELNLETADTLSRAMHGEGNLGPVSTHTTFAFPVGKKSALTLSGRRSFIDIFYKDLLKMDGAVMNYWFYDFNASFLHNFDSFNSLDINAYYGMDNGRSGVEGSNSFIGAVWGNAVGNIRWCHNKGGLKLTTQLYGSSYFMNGDLGITQNSGRAESDIIDIGLQSKADWRNWHFSAEADWYNIQPQNIFDGSSTSPGSQAMERTNSLLVTLLASRSMTAGDWTFRPSLAASLFADMGTDKTYPRLDPEVQIEYQMYHAGRLNLDAGYKHQYLFMTGMTNSGFPVEFWLAAGKYSDPQASLYATLSYSVNLFHDALTLSLQGYGKRLWHLVEYSGFLTDMIGGNYNLDKMLFPVNGYNYGATIQVQKNSGVLTGWIGYSWGRALRQPDDPSYGGLHPSSHERIHEINAVASYKVGRWEFGGNFIFASGVPYTPVTAIYYINDTMMVKYADFNSARLSPYIRLDLSVGFNIHTKGKYHDGINLSVQNATARNNQMSAVLKVRDGQYSYAPTNLIIPVLPSINYFCKF